YDSYLDASEAWDWPDPDIVVRFGASPTSKVLRHYLRDGDARQFVVDPAGEWREAEFTASDLLVADPTRLAGALAERIEPGGSAAWRERFERAEDDYWSLVAERTADAHFEGGALSTVAANLPTGSTLVVGNSMPVRELDRFGQPGSTPVRVLGNRGVSGIDGVTSTALGAASAADGPVVAVLGDVSFYHDMNGLLALQRADVDATIVVLNNDGGGIFHMLPIENFDPPFGEFFKTPHGLDFSPVGELYDAEFVRAGSLDAFESLYRESLGASGTQIIEVGFDAAESHRTREAIHEAVQATLS
ncbi:carboxylate synthase protein, partial [Halorhabdus tiamatea SARL4B]